MNKKIFFYFNRIVFIVLIECAGRFFLGFLPYTWNGAPLEFFTISLEWLTYVFKECFTVNLYLFLIINSNVPLSVSIGMLACYLGSIFLYFRYWNWLTKILLCLTYLCVCFGISIAGWAWH